MKIYKIELLILLYPIGDEMPHIKK